jgi:DNA polymerase elongation subunit (family B)
VADSICGLWVAPDGDVFLQVEGEGGGRCVRKDRLRPFLWTGGLPQGEGPSGGSWVALAGSGFYAGLAEAPDPSALDVWARSVRERGVETDRVQPWETQYLLQQRQRLFAALPFSRLRRCQLDIETASTDGTFSDPARPADRILAIGLRFGDRDRLLELAEPTDESERELLLAFTAVLSEEDPDTLEGHNIFRFDLEYLRQRARRLRVPCDWGRFGTKASWRSSRFKVGERWLDFPRCDVPGRAVIDTYFLVQAYDLTARELTSYGLKDVSVALGITPADAAASGARTYIDGAQLSRVFGEDRGRFLRYLSDDLRETQGLADLLLPTYFEQTRTFPVLLQDATLRGTTSRIDLLFLEEYYHARHACPRPPEIPSFEGGYTRSFREGVFRHVLHFDVASLYPSLLLQMGRNPVTDELGVFLGTLRSLRDYRLRYKQLARTADTEEARREAGARQASFKILINSFYGYLGFSGARFADGGLAAEVTRQGRDLLHLLIEGFAAAGCILLEADTDGIYLSSETYFDRPEALLERIAPLLPAGIELEFDGRYPAMFCYKAKNYALRDDGRVILRGSALRSRGTEPFLRTLTEQLIAHLLGLREESPLATLADLRGRITRRELPVVELARTESLSQTTESYERFVAAGGKPRRASAEAALQMERRPGLGDKVSYYLVPKERGRSSDWQRARPVERYDPVVAPYDAATYLEKIDEWLIRYAAFLSPGELAMARDSRPVADEGEFKLE